MGESKKHESEYFLTNLCASLITPTFSQTGVFYIDCFAMTRPYFHFKLCLSLRFRFDSTTPSERVASVEGDYKLPSLRAAEVFTWRLYDAADGSATKSSSNSEIVSRTMGV